MQKAMIVVLLGLGSLLMSVRAAAQGEDLYKAQCSSCHGMDGGGSTSAGKKLGLADLRSRQVQGLSDDELFKTIAYGTKHKQYPHAFMSRGITQQQITDLVTHLRKLAKNR